MNPRQRNIPVTSKEEIEVQTDIKLIESYLLDTDQQENYLRETHPQILLSKVYTHSGLLRPFTDNHLLREFSKSLKELKQSEFNEGTFAKRLQILEEQITGLMKRDLMISSVAEGCQSWNSYYSTLNQKEKTIIRLENEKIYSDLKIKRLRDRIDSLEKEVDALRTSIISTQKIGEQNKLYQSFYDKLNSIISNGKRKGIELQQLLNEQVVPIVADFSLNLTSISRTINRDIHVSIRSVVSSLSRQFDRLLKEQQFTQDKISEFTLNLITNFKGVKGVEHMKDQFDLANRAQLAQSNYKNILSLFRNEIQLLKRETPNLKAAERIDLLLDRLDGQGIQIVACKGWMNLVQPEIKVIEINSSDERLRHLIGTLGGQFKRIYTTFPQLKSHLSSSIISIIQSDILSELIEGGSLERLKEIIVHSVNQVKVDNIYKYSSTKDLHGTFHLRVLIKTLLQEIQKIRKVHGIDIALDQGILALLKQQAIDGINTQEVIALFRPHSKYVQVPIIVEKPVYQTKTFERGVAINTQTAIVLQSTKVQVVTINKEVPVYIEKPIDGTFTNNVPITLEIQKAVPVQVNREVSVDRIVQSAVECPVIREKSVPLYEQTEIVRQIQTERIVDNFQIKEVEKLVETGGKEYIEVQRIVEVPHYIYETKQQIRQVEVKVPYIVKQPEYHQIQKQVNCFIEKKQIVNIKEEIAVEIKVPQVRIVDIIEYRDRIVVTNQYKQVVKEIPVIREKQIIRQVPKEIFIERSHFIKGDQVQTIREVQVFVDKPIIKQILTTRDVEIQKIVPLYITEQIPIVTEVSVPYFTQKVKELQVEKVRLIPVKQQVVKQVKVDHPVPVVVEKEIIRVEKQIVEKIVEKIVQVPRIVEIERIVEKIVVVPRIIEKIVQVPKIIEKIIVVEQPILQIVQIPVPYIVIQQVQKIVEVFVDRPVVVYEKVIEIVQVQRVVEKIVQREKIVEVQVQRRIPYEVIREVPVPTYRDRIEYQKVQIHDTKVQTIQVQVPVIVPQKVPLIYEKAIVTQHIIENAVIQKSTTIKQVPIISEVEKLIVQQVIVERPVQNQVIKEVQVEKIVYMSVPNIIEVIREKVIELLTTKEIPKEIYLEQQKIVHQIHQRLVQVPINQIVLSPQIIQVPKLVNLVHYKEIAVDVPVREQRIKRDIVEQTKDVEVIRQVPVQVQICRQKIKEVISEVKQFITNQIIKEIYTEVQVRSPPEYQTINVPGQTIVQEYHSSNKQVQIQEKIIERLVEKIVMLPQIVEVVRNIHHISEVNSLGTAVDIDINIHTERYLGVTNELKKGLLELLTTFKSNVGRQPDLKNLIIVIEKYLKYIDDWISFPKLVQVTKDVIKEVEKERIVLVPTPDKEKQATLSFILQKLINQIRRIRDSHKITLGLQEDLLILLFPQKKADEGLDSKLRDYQEELKKKYSHFGDWSQSNPFLVNSFLQDHFALRSIIDQANSHQQSQSRQIDNLRSRLQITTNKYNNLLCFNRKMFDDNNSLIKTLEKYRNSIDQSEYSQSISIHRKFYESIIEERHSVIYQTIRKTTDIRDQSYRLTHQIHESGIDKSSDLAQLISKLSRYENRNQELQARVRRLENELSRSEQDTRIKISKIKQLQTDFEIRVSRVRQEIIKNPNQFKQAEESKKLQQKIRALERQISVEKQNTERIKKELQRANESQRRDYDRDIERKQKDIKESNDKARRQFQREITKLKADVDRIRKDKERVQSQLADTKKRTSQEIKSIRQTQMSSASDKYNQLLNQNVELRKKIDALETEYQRLKKAALENNSANQREISRLRIENQKYLSDKRGLKKEGFLDLPQQTQIINKNIELQKKIKLLEIDIERYRTKDQASIAQIKSLKEKIKRLQIQLQIAKKQVQASQKSRLQATNYQSGYKQSVSIVENVNIQGSVVRSPRSPGFKSGYDKGFGSPLESSHSRQERVEDFGSSSSRVSQTSEDQGQLPPYYSRQMSLREFIDAKHGDEKERDMYVTLVMIKVIEKIEENADRGIYNSYSPNNIRLSNFNTKNLDKLTVELGASISTTKYSKNDGVYLSPQVLGGANPSRKSTVFCLGIILDQLIHGSTFFRSVQQIQNLQIEFKVRGEKLNPILKNTLFEMMNKQPNKRLDLIEAKRRLSLQKYITSESRSTLTVTSRVGRRTTQE